MPLDEDPAAEPRVDRVEAGRDRQLSELSGTFINAVLSTMNARGNMSIGNRVMRELGEVMRTSAGRVLDNEYADGFNSAANICVNVLSDAIDGLLAKIKSGDYLSDQEQALLSRLTELKAEMEEALRNFWESEPTGGQP
ncbi:hypothetical protein ACF1AB_16160 [Streptomyces sp. NPDC014846]|uniref:hypothetical protein n=1 Tax=unclassified Streptomyces TaxID=2593676 RepID=UPI0011A2B6DC|nr:hypothetical protein [Streptomyces sp. T12]